jgi:quercetin dioxygenase-like cupin family protein
MTGNATILVMAITRETVQDVELPSVVPTTRVEVRRIGVSAGEAPGAHVHNGPVFGVVESGRVRFQIAGSPETVLGPGQTFHEPAGVVVEHFDALDEDLTFLGWFLLEEGQEATLDMV